VWHAATQTRRDAAELHLVGIVQEQHADRARLFMQWKEMSWPVMIDPLDRLGVSAVPVAVFIDETGVVRAVGAKPADLDGFLAAPAPPQAPAPAPPPRPELGPGLATDADSADALLLFGGSARLDDAVSSYQRLLEREPDHGALHFRAGVARRMRHDSPASRPGDFAAAIAHWRRALSIDPNQYIWRRRIQQYGARLDKPYSFYDWVATARTEIEARGATPLPLAVEPAGAELAQPARAFASAEPATSPDPQGRVTRDERGFVAIESTVVQGTGGRERVARVHVHFRLDAATHVHWNNESTPLLLWLDPPAGWAVDRRLLAGVNPPRAVSGEVRTLEFEVRPPEDAAPGAHAIPGFALYNVCKGEAGACLYRRQDLRIEVPLPE
jgi:hypothetical protein